jgi:hypothetical protein
LFYDLEDPKVVVGGGTILGSCLRTVPPVSSGFHDAEE